MQLQNYFAQDKSGNALPGATVYVLLAGTATMATGLQDKNGAAKANPFLSDSQGLIQFAAANGDYDIRVVKGPHDYKLTSVRFEDSKQFRLDVADSTDPAKGAAIVGWVRNDLIDAINSVSRSLDGQTVNIWEYANLIVSKPAPNDPATWDWQPAFVQAFTDSDYVRMPFGHYKHSGNINLTGKVLMADRFSRNFAAADGGVIMEFTGAIGTASFTIGGFCGMQGFTAIRSGAGKRGKIVNLGSQVERLSFFRDLRLAGCSNPFYGTGFNFYSCLVENIELGDYTDVGLYLNCPGATGSVFCNIYSSNWLNYPTTKNTAQAMVMLEGNFTESYFNQINCEHSIVSNACVVLNGVEVANLESVHIEGIELQSNARMFRVITNSLTGGKLFIRGVQADFNKCLGNDTRFLSVTTSAAGPTYVSVEGFRSRNNDINGTSNHRFAIREGSTNVNTPVIEAIAIDSDLWGGNSFLPIESTTYKPSLQQFNDQVFYRQIGGVHYMPGVAAASWPPASGAYPSNAIVMNSTVAAAGDRGWHVWAAGNFANPQNGTISYAAFSSSTTPDATAYAAYNIGDYIEVLSIVYRITNKFGGNTFLVTPNTPGTPQSGVPVLTADPQYRAIT